MSDIFLYAFKHFQIAGNTLLGGSYCGSNKDCGSCLSSSVSWLLLQINFIFNGMICFALLGFYSSVSAVPEAPSILWLHAGEGKTISNL